MAVVSMVKAQLPAHGSRKVPSFNFRKAMAMSAGWCLERSSKWLMIYWWDDSEVAQVSSAFLLTLLSVIAVLMLGKLMSVYQSPGWEHVAEDLLESIAVLVGLGWDHAFHICQITMLDYYHDEFKDDEPIKKLAFHAFSKALMALILCSLVAPAWVWYLLPAAKKPVEEES